MCVLQHRRLQMEMAVIALGNCPAATMPPQYKKYKELQSCAQTPDWEQKWQMFACGPILS